MIVGEDISPARAHGPYHLIVESLGGKALEIALSLLAPRGTFVTLGWSATPSGTTTIDIRDFIQNGERRSAQSILPQG